MVVPGVGVSEAVVSRSCGGPGEHGFERKKSRVDDLFTPLELRLDHVAVEGSQTSRDS